MKLAILLWSLTGAFCYVPTGKEGFLPDILLRDLMNHITGKEQPQRQQPGLDFNYMDLDGGALPPLDARSLTRDLEEEQMFPMDYDNLGGGNELNMHPSIRDQEFLQHSSLWGNQYVSGGAGEGQQLLRPEGVVKNQHEVKSDSTLPAYCNPPNPCPVGYTADQGCLEEFENTAAYSRNYQASQDCMCDTEHMFDCPNPSGPIVDEPINPIDEMEFNRFMQHALKVKPGFPHKNMVAKKYHLYDRSPNQNPFLTGEKLPVAAKKGTNVVY